MCKRNICSQQDKKFFKKLTTLLNFTGQLRHFKPRKQTTDNEKDFILSPVADRHDRFFLIPEKLKTMNQKTRMLMGRII